MKNTAALKIDDNSYPKIKIVEPELKAENPVFAFYQARKNWTVEDWKMHLRTQQSKWKVLPKAILNCDAFWELSNTAKAVLLRAHAELKFKKVSTDSKRGNSLFSDLIEPHNFCLPYGMLMAAGIGSKPTIKSALEELKESGWIVQVNQPARFKLYTYRLGPDVINAKITKRRPKVTLK